jgi:hypothetical protein
VELDMQIREGDELVTKTFRHVIALPTAPVYDDSATDPMTTTPAP